MTKRIILFLLIIPGLIYLIGCAPSLMKSKMAMRDHRYNLALNYALRHLHSHPESKSAQSLAERAARHYYDARRAEITRFEQLEYWDKMAAVSEETYRKLVQVSQISQINFPGKSELAFLKSKTDYSSNRQAETLYRQAQQYFQNNKFESALLAFTKVEKYITNFRDTKQQISRVKAELGKSCFQSGMNFFRKNDFSSATVQFEKVLQYVPAHQSAIDYLSRCKNSQARLAYQQGRIAMQKKDFQQALKRFREARQYVPDFEDVNFRIQRATYEIGQSILKQAEQLEARGNYQEAMHKFKNVLEYQPDNSEAQEKYQALHNKLTIRLAVLPFKTNKLDTKFGGLATDQILSSLTSKPNQFLELVDREHLQEILEEQALAQTGIIDETEAVEVGKLAGVNHIMAGNVTRVSSKAIRAVPTRKTAYYKKNYLDPKGIKRTKKAPFNYTEYVNKRTVMVSMSFRLISIETGKIIDQQTFTRTQSDAAKWVVCAKERVKDLPGAAKSNLQGSKIPKTESQLVNEALEQLSRKVATHIFGLTGVVRK